MHDESDAVGCGFDASHDGTAHSFAVISGYVNRGSEISEIKET